MVNFDFTKTPLSMVKGKREYSSFKTVISIVTPTYNPSSLIMETKDCILNQTYPYFEWIIVDDGSTNKESLRILDKLSKEDDRIKVLHKKNEGLSKTRDYGVKHSSKDTMFVVFIDDDDYLSLTYLECAYVSMLTHKDAGWCYSDVVNFGGIESLWNKQFSCGRLKNENILVSQAMVRKKAFYDVEGFMLEGNGHYEDWIFWLKLLAKGYSPIHMGFYGFWYRRKSDSGQHKLAKENHKRNMKEIAFYASKVEKDVLPIEYPKDDYNWDGINDSIPDVVIPKFKKNGKKNILVIVPWMTLGGADKFNLDLFKMMNKDKFSITLLSMQPTEYAWRLKFEEACDEVFDLSTFLDRKDWLAFVNYIIESRGIDVIFNTNSVTGYMMLPYLSVKYEDIPILDYIHMEEWYNRNGGYSRDSASVSSVIDKTLFCNKNSEHIMNEYFKVDKKKLGTVYIGVDENKFYPDKYDKNELLEKYDISPSSFVIGLVARIDYQKRPFLLMRIIEETVKSGKIENVLFLIAGDGPLLKDIKLSLIHI